MTRGRAIRDSLVLLGFAALTAVFTYPLVLQLGSHLGGGGGRSVDLLLEQLVDTGGDLSGRQPILDPEPVLSTRREPGVP